MGLVDVIAVVGSAEVRGLGVVTKVGRWRLAGMAVGWIEVNVLEVVRVGRCKLVGMAVGLVEVNELEVVRVGR